MASPHMISPVTRRRALARLAGLPSGVLLALRGVVQGFAEGPVRLGLVLPAPAEATEQIRLGAEAGLREGNTFAEFFGKSLALIVEEAAGPGEAARKATDLVRKARVAAVVGGADDGQARALREVAAREAALFVNVGAPADDLRGAACHARMFHVQPSDAMYAETIAAWLADRRKVTRWGLLAAETGRGRALRDAALGAIRKARGTVVAQAPLADGGDRGAALRAAAGSDAQAVFLALESGEQLAVVRAAKAAGLSIPLAAAALRPGDFLSPELLGAKGFWAALWYHEWTRFSARELNRRFLSDFKTPMEGLGWAAWAAVRLLAEAAVRAEATGAAAWRAFLESDYPFDGHKGEQLTFRPWDHQLRVVFGVLTPRAAPPASGEAGIYESLADNVPRDLDAAGILQEQTGCRLGS